MPEIVDRVVVASLSEPDWHQVLETATGIMPFGGTPWLRWGAAAAAGFQFNPVLLDWGRSGELLVPLCVSGTAGRIGAFGYGMVCPTVGWQDRELPGFDELAAALCAATGLTRLRTLLPPPGLAAAVDRLTGHWDAVAGPPTYLLDLSGGAGMVWAGARGSVRTAVRRAGAHGVRSDVLGPQDGAAVAQLYRSTLERNQAAIGDQAPDLAFLGEGRPDVLARVARDADGVVQAISAFAVGHGCAFHVLQATSETGRRTNAGHLAFFSAVSDLEGARVRRIDLGSAKSGGQERFKRNWGGVAVDTRSLSWAGDRW